MILALFDIDGTLLTTSGAGRPAIQAAASEVCGLDLTLEGVPFSGRTDPAILEDIFVRNGLDPGRIPVLVEGTLAIYGRELSARLRPEDVTVLPGVRLLLDLLTDRTDVHLGIVTGNVRAAADIKLRKASLGGYFSFGAYGCDSADRNLLPAIAWKRGTQLLRRHIPASRTVVIGDTTHDIACSRYFGACCVAVSTGHFTHEELHSHSPDLLIRSLGDGQDVVSFLDEMIATAE